MVPVEYYVGLSAVLFTIGAMGVLIRRNPLVIFMSIELMLNAANLALVLIGEAGYLVFFRGVPVGAVAAPVESFGSPQQVGESLFNSFLLPFEITSVLLLIAMVGAIILTQKGGRS